MPASSVPKTASSSKISNRSLPVNEIIWGRYLFHGIALSLLMGPRLKWDLVRTAHPGMQIMRIGSARIECVVRIRAGVPALFAVFMQRRKMRADEEGIATD